MESLEMLTDQVIELARDELIHVRPNDRLLGIVYIVDMGHLLQQLQHIILSDAIRNIHSWQIKSEPDRAFRVRPSSSAAC